MVFNDVEKKMDSWNEEKFYKNLVEIIRTINERFSLRLNDNKIEIIDY